MVLLFFVGFFICMPVALAVRQIQYGTGGDDGYLGREVNDPIPAKRGCILDRNGRQLAGCAARYEIFANPSAMREEGTDVEKAAQIMGAILGEETSRVFIDLTRDSHRVVLCDSSSPEQRDELMEFKLKEETKYILQEIGIERLYERVYPGRGVPGNVLGWVRREEGSLVGVDGLELTFDYMLRGHDGLRTGVRGLNGSPLDTSYRVVEEPVDGNDILLTIDRDIQVIAYERLSHWMQKTGGLRGAALVVEAGSGDLLAIAQYPCIDPYNYDECVDNTTARKDFACRSVYEPGSVGKAFAAAMGISEGLIKPETTFFVDHAPIYIDNYPVGEYHTIWPNPGRRSLTEIIVKSSNVGMSRVGLALKGEVVVKALHQFGMASQPDLGLLGMPKAIVPEKDKHPCGIETANMSFGQGYAATPAQIALAFNVFASDGWFHPGRLVYGVRDTASGTLRTVEIPVPRLAITEESCEQMVEILHRVTSSEGTGKNAVPAGWEIAGKTGTAQVPSPDGGYYSEHEGYYMVSFAGFGPLPEPKYTILVVIEKPRGGKQYDSGGKCAAPCFKEIFSALMDLDSKRADGE